MKLHNMRIEIQITRAGGNSVLDIPWRRNRRLSCQRSSMDTQNKETEESDTRREENREEERDKAKKKKWALIQVYS